MLPVINHPIVEITVPSKKTKVKFRPFLGREEKILLMSAESGEELDYVNAMKEVIAVCALEKLDVNSLTSFDLEYTFLKLRAASVNNICDLSFQDTEDEQVYDFKVDLNTVEIVYDPEHTNKVKVTDNVTILLKYPSMAITQKFDESTTKMQVLDTALLSSIDKIYDAETIYEEYTEKELQEFLDKLPISATDQISKFFATSPKLYHKIEYKNKLEHDRSIELTSLKDFFSLV